MVIGNGILANIFKDYVNDDSVIIFASGVSNSKENKTSEFDREVNLLMKFAGTSSRLVYFSTCSIFDTSIKNSLYIKHKINVESIIQENFTKYWIVRLPNVIGNSTNNNTMVNFFCDSINNDKPFILQSKAFRYFIDVTDIKIVFDSIISDGQLESGRYNLLYPKPYKVLSLVELLENLLKKKANYKVEEDGIFYYVDISSELLPFVNFVDTAACDYLYRVLEKYLTPIYKDGEK